MVSFIDHGGSTIFSSCYWLRSSRVMAVTRWPWMYYVDLRAGWFISNVRFLSTLGGAFDLSSGGRSLGAQRPLGRCGWGILQEEGDGGELLTSSRGHPLSQRQEVLLVLLTGNPKQTQLGLVRSLPPRPLLDQSRGGGKWRAERRLSVCRPHLTP